MVMHSKHLKLVFTITVMVLSLTIAATGVSAQAGAWDPYVQYAIISPAPMLPLEYNGTGVATFAVGNNGGTDLPLGSPGNPDDLMTVVVSLANGEPNVADPDDPIVALTALAGEDTKDFWDWTYTPATRTFRGVQKKIIPAFTTEEITIQYRVTLNTPRTNAFNGFNVNIQPPGYTNPQTTDNDNASSYTFVESIDYGDAPSSYGEAGHEIDLTKDVDGLYNRYIYLGDYVDPDPGYQASEDARGDDDNQTGGLGVDDEDGVTFPDSMQQGETYIIPVVVTLWDWDPSLFIAAQLGAWIDWNQDGTFAVTDERIAQENLHITLIAEPAWIGPRSFTVNVTVNVPLDIPNGYYYARFRFGPVVNPTAMAAYGEIEDYRIYIGTPTSVTLANFDVVPVDAETLRVEWGMVTEDDILGYHLWRSETGDRSQAVQITQEMIEAQGDLLFGAEYLFDDGQLQPDTEYSYWLQAISSNGQDNEYGPATGRTQAEAVEEPDTLNRLFLPLLTATTPIATAGDAEVQEVQEVEDYEIQSQSAPTAVSLLSLEVAAVDATTLQVEWSIAGGENVSSVHLWRSENEERSQAVLIMEEMIELQGDLISGTNSHFVDSSLQPDTRYHYWLETIDANASVTELGSATDRTPALPVEEPDAYDRIYLPFLNQ